MVTTTTKWVSALLVAGLAVCAGCSKSDSNRPQPSKAAMDLPKLQQAFPAATPEQQACLSQAGDGIRYSLYPKAIAALEKLAADATLSEPQKKAVADMMEGIKQAMAQAPAAPAQ